MACTQAEFEEPSVGVLVELLSKPNMMCHCNNERTVRIKKLVYGEKHHGISVGFPYVHHPATLNALFNRRPYAAAV